MFNNIKGWGGIWTTIIYQTGFYLWKNFVLNSGSLKEIAKLYGVSYPTVRLRLDRLIEKIKINDSMENEEFIKFIRRLAIDDRISMEDAKLIIEKYKNERVEK